MLAFDCLDCGRIHKIPVNIVSRRLRQISYLHGCYSCMHHFLCQADESFNNLRSPLRLNSYFCPFIRNACIIIPIRYFNECGRNYKSGPNKKSEKFEFEKSKYLEMKNICLRPFL